MMQTSGGNLVASFSGGGLTCSRHRSHGPVEASKRVRAILIVTLVAARNQAPRLARPPFGRRGKVRGWNPGAIVRRHGCG